MSQTKPNPVIVFDFGGVVFDVSATDMYRRHFSAAGRSAAEAEHFLTHIFTAESRADANYGTIGAIIDKLVQTHPAWKDELEIYRADRDFIKMVKGTQPGMINLINDLRHKHGLRVFGLTNWAADAYDTLARYYAPLINTFNDVVVSGRERMKKPDPKFFQLAQECFNTAPENIYFFDDKQANVDAARALGWNAFQFESAQAVRNTLKL